MKKDRICVRAATLDDTGILSNLLDILFTEEAEFAPNAIRQTEALRLIISQPAIGQILCAIEKDQIVGMVSILFSINTAEGGRAAWLEDMVVQRDKRKRGIGEQLLHEAIRVARTAGCSRITLLTDVINQTAQRLYERGGFRRSKMVPFRLHL